MSTKPPEPSPEQIAQWWAEARDAHADNLGLAPIQLARLAYAAGWEARAAVKDSLTAEAPSDGHLRDATKMAPPPAEGEVGELVCKLGWIAAQCADIGWADDSITVDRAAALLQRQAAPVPVAVSERPWEREAGWLDLDDECWWCPPEGSAYWQMADPVMVYGGWVLPAGAIPIPYSALPLPSGEAANG